jgi:hypothetical protein
MTKFIFITGGVVSSLGKGIAASSLAAILEARGLNVTMTKLDPYINVDPGTMSPFQHGEVFSVGCADDWKRIIYVMRFVPQHILQHALVAVKNKKLPYFNQY